MDSDMEHSDVVPKPVFKHHTLHMHFPAVELLPKGKGPYIEKPENIADRDEPELTSIGLTSDETEMYIRIPTVKGVSRNDATFPASEDDLPLLGEPHKLSSAFARLGAFPGISHLDIVSYIQDDDVLTRFRLTTVFFTEQGMLAVPALEFELGSAELNPMLRLRRRLLQRLRDVIQGASDRACLNRSSLLDEYDPECREALETSWVHQWDSHKIKSVKELFADRLHCWAMSEEGEDVLEPIGALRDCKGEAMRVQLPCGHSTILAANHIHRARNPELLNAVCSVCNRRIMTKEDDLTLVGYGVRLLRWEWEDQMEKWDGMDKRVRSESRRVEIKLEDFLDSLSQAYDSFELPQSINPPDLCPTKMPESQRLFDRLRGTLMTFDVLPACVPATLFKQLEELAWTLIAEPFSEGAEALMNLALPPGFDVFVSRWLTRALNHAISKLPEEDEDMMDLISKMEKTEVDEAKAASKAAVASDLEDVLGMLDRTKLEEMTGKHEMQLEDEDEEL